MSMLCSFLMIFLGFFLPFGSVQWRSDTLKLRVNALFYPADRFRPQIGFKFLRVPFFKILFSAATLTFFALFSCLIFTTGVTAKDIGPRCGCVGSRQCQAMQSHLLRMLYFTLLCIHVSCIIMMLSWEAAGFVLKSTSMLEPTPLPRHFIGTVCYAALWWTEWWIQWLVQFEISLQTSNISHARPSRTHQASVGSESQMSEAVHSVFVTDFLSLPGYSEFYTVHHNTTDGALYLYIY